MMQSDLFTKLLEQVNQIPSNHTLENPKTSTTNPLLEKIQSIATISNPPNADSHLNTIYPYQPNPTQKDDRLFKIVNIARSFKELHNLNINEENTINALVAPVLAILGWDRSNLNHVKSEWRKRYPNGKVDTKRCDFALFLSRQDPRPIALVEAKSVRERLDDAHIDQVMSYAFSANVRWAILTNGLEWRLYDTFQKGMFSKNSLVFRENIECLLEYEPCQILSIAKDNILSLDELVYGQLDLASQENYVDEDYKNAENKALELAGEREFLVVADKMRPISLQSFVEHFVSLDSNKNTHDNIWKYCTNKEIFYSQLFDLKSNSEKSIRISIPYLSKKTAEDLFAEIRSLCKFNTLGSNYILQNTRVLLYFNQTAPSYVAQEFVKSLKKHETNALAKISQYTKASSFLYGLEFSFDSHPFVIASTFADQHLSETDKELPISLYINGYKENIENINEYQPDPLYFLLWYFYLGCENLFGFTNDISDITNNKTQQSPIFSVLNPKDNKIELHTRDKSWFFTKFKQAIHIAQQIELDLLHIDQHIQHKHEDCRTKEYMQTHTHSYISSILCSECENAFLNAFKAELCKYSSLIPCVDKEILKTVANKTRKRNNRLPNKI